MKILILGVTFKENVSDVRNSKVIDVYNELRSFGVEQIDVLDPHASHKELKEEYGVDMADEENGPYDAIIAAVSHDEYASLTEEDFLKKAKKDAVFVDVKGIYKDKINKLDYWSL
jgi:UDP-N-acetyl-D-galactosamine dehydrogenase